MGNLNALISNAIPHTNVVRREQPFPEIQRRASLRERVECGPGLFFHEGLYRRPHLLRCAPLPSGQESRPGSVGKYTTTINGGFRRSKRLSPRLAQESTSTTR